MIRGDRLIINREGISIIGNRMESIRIYPKSQVYMLPMRTFEFRPNESATQFPVDIFLTPLPPEKWPFVMRFNIRLTNRPGTFEKVYKFFEKLSINVLSSETVRSGHHHDTLNVLGEITRLEVKSLKSIFRELKEWKKDREKIYRKMYSEVYRINDLQHYFSEEKYDNLKKRLKENKNRDNDKLLKEIEDKLTYSTDSNKYYFNLDEIKVLCNEKLKQSDYEEVPIDFIKKDIGNEEGEFHCPMWYEIIESYAKQSEQLEDRLILNKKLKNNIDKEFIKVKKWKNNFLNEKKKKKTNEEDIEYDETIIRELTEKTGEDKESLLNNFPDFIYSLIKKIKNQFKIDFKPDDLTGIIEFIGKKIEKERVIDKSQLGKLRFLKKITVLTKIIMDSVQQIEFWKLELDGKDECLLKKLEDLLDILSDKKDEENKKKFSEKLGVYLAYKYRNDNMITIEELLEKEIKRARPKVFKLKTNRSIEPVDKYVLIQKEMLIIKAILSALVTYKKMLGYRFKLLLVEDSLEYDKCKYTSEDFIENPSESYIYNIRYYEHILRYPYFAKRAILHSSLSNPIWKVKMLNIIDRLKRLPKETKIEWDIDPANHLDPIEIFPLESLSHAFYHRIYEKDLAVTAQEDYIPFHSTFPIELINNLLPEKNLSTYGIASFNSESLSCRICPIPANKLSRFAEIELTKSRNCLDDCVRQGKKIMALHEREKNEELKKENLDFLIKLDLIKMFKDHLNSIEEEYFNLLLNRYLKEISKEDISKKITVILDEILEQDFNRMNSEYLNKLLEKHSKKLKERCLKKMKYKGEIKEKEINDNLTIELKNKIDHFLKVIQNGYKEKVKEKGLTGIMKKSFKRMINIILSELDGENLKKASQTCNSIFEKKIFIESRNGSCLHKQNINGDIYCSGSSMGLMSTWLNALSRPLDPIEKYGFNFNIWRTFNKTTRLDDEKESGDITVWAQAIKTDFLKFPPDINSLIRENFNANLHKKFPHGHLRGENINVNKFFSSSIFVSLPFDHPMHKEWLFYISKKGKESGFSEIKATETYTNPVTQEVAKDIDKCQAMIQILSLADIADDKNPAKGLEWLYAEYLTAISKDKLVIRLVDRATIKNDVRIGKDHMTFNFSRMEPFSDFEKRVDEAFDILKRELLDIHKI